VLDLQSVAFRYDDVAGTVLITWAYYDDVRKAIGAGGAGGMFSAVRPIGPNVPNDSADAVWSMWSGNASASLSLFGSTGSLPGTVTISPDGRVVTAEFSHAMLAGHDWRFTWGGSVTSGDGFGDVFHKFWFDGFSDPNPPLGPGGPVTPGPGAPGGPGDADQAMTINDGAQYTNDPDVTLSVTVPSWANTLRVANDGGFHPARTFPVKNRIRWRLAESGPERLPKTVYLRFDGQAPNFTDDIILDQTKPTISSATVDGPGATATSAAAAVATAASNGRTYRVRVRAKDATSGVSKVQFALRSTRHPSAMRRFERVTRYNGLRAPKYLRVRDRAGNYSRWRSIR